MVMYTGADRSLTGLQRPFTTLYAMLETRSCNFNIQVVLSKSRKEKYFHISISRDEYHFEKQKKTENCMLAHSKSAKAIITIQGDLKKLKISLECNIVEGILTDRS